MDLPTVTYLYQYLGSGLILALCLWLGHKGGLLTRRWMVVLVGGFVAYALAHAFFQFVAPMT